MPKKELRLCPIFFVGFHRECDVCADAGVPEPAQHLEWPPDRAVGPHQLNHPAGAAFSHCLDNRQHCFGRWTSQGSWA